MTNGIATKKIMMVPCAEKNLVVVFGWQVTRGVTRSECELGAPS